MTIRAYARVSMRRDESQSISQQTYKVERWAEYQHPNEPLEWYKDEGVSGAKRGIKRPERDRLLQEMTKGDVLAVTKVDRLARSTRDLLDIVHLAEDRGASVVFIEQGIDTSGPYGRFMLTLLAAIAELEAGIIAERVVAAREEFARQGRHGAGRVPYGFHTPHDRDRGFKVVRPHPIEGPKLRQAIQAVLAGESQASQAEALGLNQATFQRILHNPRLYGWMPGGKVDPDAALLSMAEWRRLQEAMNGSGAWSRAPGYGAAFLCWQCHERLYLNRSWANGQGGYACSSKKHKGSIAIRRSIADDWAERWFLERYGDAPMETAIRIGEGDGGREERLAGVDVQLELVAQSITMPGADVAALAQEAQQLHAERQRIEAEVPEVEWVMVPTGETMREHWGKSDDESRTKMLLQVVRFVVHPRGRVGGRIEAVPIEQ